MNTTEARTNGAWKLGSLIAVLVLVGIVAFLIHRTNKEFDREYELKNA